MVFQIFSIAHVGSRMLLECLPFCFLFSRIIILLTLARSPRHLLDHHRPSRLCLGVWLPLYFVHQHLRKDFLIHRYWSPLVLLCSYQCLRHSSYRHRRLVILVYLLMNLLKPCSRDYLQVLPWLLMHQVQPRLRPL